MNQPPTVLRGIVHGNTIEFESNLGLVDGQEVSVTVLPVQGYTPAGLPPFLIEARQRLREAREQAKNLAPGEGLRRAAGSCAKDAEEIDELVKLIYEHRALNRPPLEL